MNLFQDLLVCLKVFCQEMLKQVQHDAQQICHPEPCEGLLSIGITLKPGSHKLSLTCHTVSLYITIIIKHLRVGTTKRAEPSGLS
jgi:hypothetical protein